MTIMRAQLGFPFDTDFARDVITLNPHFDGPDPAALAIALKANLIAVPAIGATTPFTIKVYDAKKAPPSYPLATASQGTGHAPSSLPREVALCLSYYGGFNRPRFRGRLYIPSSLIAGSAGLRPTTTQMNNVGAWANTLGKNLPGNTWWTLYSRKAGTAAQVTNWWVDDEWDTVRSRGMRAGTRITGTVP
jgi:hypothetical protein